MQLDVPFFSQLDEQVPKEMQRSACGVACIKMILDFSNQDIIFSDLLREANIVGGREDGFGWTHETLVRVLRNHGTLAYCQEFRAHTINLETGKPIAADHSAVFENTGLGKIKDMVSQGKPVIVSVRAGFSQDSENKKSVNMVNHLALIVGSGEGCLYVNDPIFNKQTSVTEAHFMEYWRGLAIFTE